MGRSPPRDSATIEALLERIRTLYVQLDDSNPDAPEYERLSAEIRQLCIAFAKLVDAEQVY